LFGSLGIVQQVETEGATITDNCLKKYCAIINQQYPCNIVVNQMKSILFSKRLARGPAYGHVFDETLIENEDFCLQTDTHAQVIQVNLMLFYLSFFLRIGTLS
jgi:hypothetical protein